MRFKYLILFLILVLSAGQVYPQQTQTQPQPQTQPAAQVPKDFNNGLQAALEATRELGLVDDPALTRRVNDIGYRVAQRASPDRPYYSFRVVKMEEPNAFALPGGFIFVTSGMLDLGLTDDELAALLGHEITHVVNNHGQRMAKRQTIMNLLLQALVVGVAVGIKDNSGYDPVTGVYKPSAKGQVLQGAEVFGILFQELLLRGFSRDFELEADHGGMIAAAGAGFSPEGTGQLFEKMRKKVYEAPGYGYLRTHPYLEDRVEIARSFASILSTSKNPPEAADFRIKTQQTFLSALPSTKTEEAKAELRRMALNALPTGKAAEDIRWWFIHKAEAEDSKKESFYRDYGKLIKLYKDNITEVKDTSVSAEFVREFRYPEEKAGDSGSADFIKKLQLGLQKVEKDRDAVLPTYDEVLAKGMFDTEMLKRYLSNFPDSPRTSEIKFHLAENYRILQKYPDATDLYLAVLSSNEDSEWKTKARASLAQMVSNLGDLTACFKIATQTGNPELALSAQARMKTLSVSFDTMKNGYEFRRSFPGSTFEKPVLDRLNNLASDAVHQGKLYQAIGEYQKALDQYNLVLKYCSDMPIADQVKDTVVDFEELTSNKNAPQS